MAQSAPASAIILSVSRFLDGLARRASAVRLPWLAAVGGLTVLVLAVLGAVFLTDNAYVEACECWSGSGPIAEFNLDGEFTVPAAISGLALLAAAALALLLARSGSALQRRSAFAGLGVFLAAMAADEIWAVHEKLEGAVGVDWQVLYAPAVLVAGASWLIAYPAFRRLGGRGVAFFLAAPGAWLASQAVEKVQWDGDRLVHPWTIVPEEALELTGSLLFIAAFLQLIRAHAPPSPG